MKFSEAYPTARHYYYENSAYGEIGWSKLTLDEQATWTQRWQEAHELNEPETPDDDVDLVNHPPHYTNGPKCPGCGRTIECIDITRWLPFNPGNAIKYLWRRYFGGKAGEESVQPVEKARWYLDDEVARLKLGKS